MQWSITTAATGTVLTWEQIKHHVRPGSVSEQPYIMGDLLPSATSYAETMLQCVLLPQTITAVYDINDIGWRSEEFGLPFGMFRHGWELPRGPMIGQPTSVTDANGNAVMYRIHTAGNADFIVPLQAIAYTQCPVTVVYQAGYPSGIPADILNAIRVHVATLYMVREDTTNLAANPVHKIDDFYRFRGRGSFVA
jgi:hypothetical protein